MCKITMALSALLSLSLILELGSCHVRRSAIGSIFRRIKYASPSQGDPGQPLFLTPYIESGKTEEGRQLSMVGLLPGPSVKSYSGYLTVNKTHNSNLFFWFFPAQVQPEKAPVLLWLQGGPGGTSMFGLFVEHGPYIVQKNLTLTKRMFPWTSKFSMLYIDNPVGTGFSFTGDGKGYAKNEEDVGRDLYSAIVQFFQLFPDYQKNDFYATGEMLGGYAEFLYQIGLVDEKQRVYVQNQTNLGQQYIQQKKWKEAFEVFDTLLNGDKTGSPPYIQTITGCSNYYNFLQCQEPADQEYFGNLLSLPNIRKSIHVGNLTFHDGSIVEEHLIEDIMKTIKPWLAILMDHYRVLLYSGQLDIIVAAPLTERFLPTVPWAKMKEYKNAERIVWRIYDKDPEVAGYVRQVDEFYQVIVRGGGHILPYDQPERALDMMDRFITGKGWKRSGYGK
ncbi:probable serine carboxypeptidase CPVL isoform X2 [Python bivittatus]|uniref:Probable serine carboxypeptidase CPVL isoform X2 n=1 Tax=Python bivittatus TaxID=176946 RepID=A0A9F5IS77_PYTBI|nr:probable serine carboxypeptidase CPVL isoform X2 [Python bivittatus]